MLESLGKWPECPRTFEVCRENGGAQEKGQSSRRMMTTDSRADVPKSSQPLYFGVIITERGQVTMLLVHMIDSRESSPSVNQAGSAADSCKPQACPAP